MELQLINDSSQWNWGLHIVGGGVDPRELGFLLPFVLLLDIYIWNGPWTGDGTLPSPGGSGSILYEPQPVRGRPVSGSGELHTLRELSIPVIYQCSFLGCRSCIYVHVL